MALIDKTSIGTGNTIQAEHITRIIDALNESGSATIIATGSFTGSFVGDASGLTGITSVATASYAHYAVSASYEINYETSSSYADFAKTASYITLPQVLTAGNTTSGNNIQVTDNDYLEIGSAGPTWQFKKNSVNGWLEVYNSDEGYNTQIFDQEYFYSQGIEVSERIKFRVGGYGSANPSGDLLTSITAGRAWTLPDASGTIALTTDTLATSSYALTASYVEYSNIANTPTLISSSSQIASEISGAFTDASSSIATDINTNYTNTVITASNSGNDDTIEFLKGSGGSFGVTVNNVQNATSSSLATAAKQLTGTTRTVYTVSTTNATPATIFLPAVNIFPGSTEHIVRMINASVIGTSASGSLTGEFSRVYDIYDGGTTSISTTGTLTDNITTGTPAFSINAYDEVTYTGVASTDINWTIIIERIQEVS